MKPSNLESLGPDTSAPKLNPQIISFRTLQLLILALGVTACAPAKTGDGPTVLNIPKETVSDVRAKMVEFCSQVPSDVDGIECTLHQDGEPVASMYESCWSARPSSEDSEFSNLVVDHVDLDNCEIVPAQY